MIPPPMSTDSFNSVPSVKILLINPFSLPTIDFGPIVSCVVGKSPSGDNVDPTINHSLSSLFTYRRISYF